MDKHEIEMAFVALLAVDLPPLSEIIDWNAVARDYIDAHATLANRTDLDD